MPSWNELLQEVESQKDDGARSLIDIRETVGEG